MKSLFLLILSGFSILSFGQPEKEILEEGFELYYSEKASWLGTDLLYEAWQELADSIAGYLSYRDGEVFRCIFFNADATPKVILAFDFQKDFVIENAVTSN